MKKILRYIAVLAVAATGLGGCSNDLAVENTNDHEVIPGVIIRIPNPDAAAQFGTTRSEGDGLTRAEEEGKNEGNINTDDLYLVVIDADGKASPYLLKEYTSNIENTATSYTIPLEEGSYSFYVLANLKDYVSTSIPEIKTEEEVKEIILNFADNNNGLKLQAGNLPMACLAGDIKKGVSPIGSDGKIEIKDAVTINADLTFLCSKVRYTVLFDRGSFSSGFSTDNIDFGKDVTVSKARKETGLDNEKASSDFFENLSATLNSVEYPTDSNSPYFNIANAEASLADLSPLTEGNSSSDKKAWQGMIYLPENLQSEDKSSDRTTLLFTATGDEAGTDYKITPTGKTPENGLNGLKRGKFYDYVAKVSKATESNLDVSGGVSDWSLEKLIYTLSGPVELVVETTEIPITSGVWSTFWYRSGVSPEDIKFSFPKYNDEDFYKANVMKDSQGRYLINEAGDYMIRITVNDAIPSDLQGGEKSLYDFFHIQAGNISKKIGVSPLNIRPYLNVYPQVITINVEEFVNSGSESQTLTINYETNIDPSLAQIKIKDESGIISGDSFDGAIKVSGDGLTASDGSYSLSNKSGELNLMIDKLQDDISFWQTGATYVLEFSVDGVEETKDVIVFVIP